MSTSQIKQKHPAGKVGSCNALIVEMENGQYLPVAKIWNGSKTDSGN